MGQGGVVQDKSVFEENISFQNISFRQCVYRIDSFKGILRVSSSEGIMPEYAPPCFSKGDHR